jgi:hypothetical protein
MATPRSAFSVAAGAAFAAIVLTIPLNGFADIDNAKARITGTFHLSHSSHERPPFIDTIESTYERLFTPNILTYEQAFKY